MRRILLAGAALAFIATPAFAKNSAIPAQNPVATVVLPDDWDADEIDNGVEVTSKDDEIYMAFEVTKASKAEAALNEGLDYLKGKGVKLDDSSMKQEELTINGMKGIAVNFTGKDNDGDTRISLMLLGASKDRLVMLTFWGTPDGAKANAETLTKITDSIKPVNWGGACSPHGMDDGGANARNSSGGRPGRDAARSGASLIRDPSRGASGEAMGPVSAPHHFVLRCARDDQAG